MRRWNETLDNLLHASLERLDRLHAGLDSTRTPGTPAWLVTLVVVDLLTLALTGLIAAGLAYALNRWTSMPGSSVWVGFALAALVFVALDVRHVRRARRTLVAPV